MNWISSTIGNFCPFIYGQSLPEREREEGSVPVYGSNGIVGFHREACVFGSGVIIGRKGSVGFVHFSNHDFWPIDTTFYVNKESESENRFCYYLLSTLDLQGMNFDAAVPGLNRENAHALEIRIPDLSEDRERLIEPLKTLDEKIALNRKLNETLEGMAQALFQSWFVDFDPVKAKLTANRHGRDPEKACMAALSGKLRIRPGKPKPETLAESAEASAKAEHQLPTAEELDAAIAALDSLTPAQLENLTQTAAHFPANFQESELGLVPGGWEITAVEKLVKRLKAGKKFTKKNVLSKGMVPVFEQGESTLMGFHEGQPDIDASKTSPGFIFGDHTCITYISILPFSVGPNVIPLKASIRDGFWTYHAIKDLQSFQEYRRHWMEFKIKKTEVPAEILAEKFGLAVQGFYETIELLDNQSRTLAELRDTLLPKLLSGELTVCEASQTVKEAIKS